MEKNYCSSKCIANLAISSIAKLSDDCLTWKKPFVHKAILLSGLSVFIASIKLLEEDI